MRRRPPRSTLTDTLFPYTTLFRSDWRLRRGHVSHDSRPPVYLHVRTPAGAVPAARCNTTPCRSIRTRPHAERTPRSEEHTSELQSLMRISYAVFCLKK